MIAGIGFHSRRHNRQFWIGDINGDNALVAQSQIGDMPTDIHIVDMTNIGYAGHNLRCANIADINDYHAAHASSQIGVLTLHHYTTGRNIQLTQ
tara:strand:+ start:35790 stop:36071 length:282 start_codon:yes stop_codon:yes gene_type:complete